MSFQTKLSLSDRKFQQSSGETLSLSGDSIFTGKVTINPRDGIVDGTDAVNKDYVDALSAETLQLSSQYTGATPSNIEVGGLAAGSQLTGNTLSKLFERILIKTFTPTFVPPSNTFAFDPSQPSLQEVGVTASTIGFSAGFNQGQINLQGSLENPRSGGANEFNYFGTGLPATQSTVNNVDSQSISNYVILQGSNTWSSSVDYDAGPQPLDSNGDDFDDPLSAGTTNPPQSVNINGIYPYFYGSSITKPTAGSTLLTTAQDKVVEGSDGSVSVNFNTGDPKYTWLAIPSTSTNKNGWIKNAVSFGSIDTSSPTSDKYVRTDDISVNSPNGLWNSINYDFYISEAVAIEASITFTNADQG